MEPKCETPRLVFPDGLTDRDEWEMERKGYVYAFLECQDGCRYQVMFIDPVRLSQDIEATLRSGQPYYYEFGQVVVPEVTIAAITKIIPLLVEEEYFERHLPWHQSQANKKPQLAAAAISASGTPAQPQAAPAAEYECP